MSNSADNASLPTPCLGVVIPVFNEAATVGVLLRAVLAQPLVREVVAVDDGSTDGTPAVLEAAARSDSRVQVLRHERNLGKGAALRTGFLRVTAPITVVQDADLEYDPAEYPTLVRPILAGKADVVFSSRFQSAGAHRVLYFWHFVGNKCLTLLSDMVTDLNLTDIESGPKVFRTELLRQIRIEENRFGFEPEIIAKVARIPGVRIYEVPVSYYGRTYAEGKKVGWRDGLRALWCIIKYNLLRRG
jgi:glycosyltransferase involved in cell wall biosynthesis